MSSESKYTVFPDEMATTRALNKTMPLFFKPKTLLTEWGFSFPIVLRRTKKSLKKVIILVLLAGIEPTSRR